MFILAHADHPEMFFMGLLVGALVVGLHILGRRVRR